MQKEFRIIETSVSQSNGTIIIQKILFREVSINGLFTWVPFNSIWFGGL